ncbi:UBX domain-containing protein 7-like [Paramacrobiotus metropolitanus]|uniref:UBX domain-containing protein 7-like n=1 Tax=Paramacrobiotus metropolitanus TaxID=2943436 RepID=UPI0024464CBC|nr:UBX domain-containing protein 7-like [Paramacrobiotus metropolitanus]
MESTSSGRTLRSKHKQPASEPTTLTPSSSDSDIQEIPAESSTTRPKRRTKKFLFSPDKKSKTDHVRAPIPQITQILSEGDQFAVLANDQPVVDLRAQFRDQKARKAGTKANSGLFDSLRDYKTDMDAYLQNAMGGSFPGTSRAHSKTLTDIFRIPPEILTEGTFDQVRQRAFLKKRWLMVNIHNYTEFACQRLIRDCLVHEAVKEIILENFVFWHANHDTREGLRYRSHYQAQSFPYLAIIDPRTGEKVATYGEMNVMGFCNQISEFLAERPSFDKTEPSVVVSSKPDPIVRRESVIIYDPEEEEMERALKASEQEEKARKARDEQKDKEHGMDDVLEGFVSEEEEEPPVKPEKTKEPAEKVEIVEEPKASIMGAWKAFLGSVEDPEVALKIRLPNGTSLDLSIPNSSKLAAITLFVEEKGFSGEKFEILTGFPKRNLSEMERETALKEAGLGGREMLIVQAKD